MLLLHGFTGNSADVRQLGRYLQKGLYILCSTIWRTCSAPEEILKSSPFVWFKDVLDGYDYLVDQGYEEIAVAGLSLGGAFALKLSLNRDVKGIITMCAPMENKTEGSIYEGFLEYARNFKNMKAKINKRLIKKWNNFIQLKPWENWVTL